MSRVRGAGEPAHGDAADAVGAFRILVLPGDVVLRAAGQDVDVVAGGQALGDEAAQVLGSAEHLRAVALDDEGDFHDSVWSSAVELARDAGVAEIGEPAALAGDDLRAQVVVEGQRAEELGGEFEILRRELDAGAAQRVGDGGGGVREHRHVGSHRLDQRHAEAFVLAHRDVDRGVAVVHRELFVGNRAGEHESVIEEAELRHQRANHRIIPRHHVEPADEDEAVVGVDVALVELGQPDDVLDLLVRRDPADEQEVDEAVVEDARRAPAGAPAG